MPAAAVTARGSAARARSPAAVRRPGVSLGDVAEPVGVFAAQPQS
jgi:hypothetical protein